MTFPAALAVPLGAAALATAAMAATAARSGEPAVEPAAAPMPMAATARPAPAPPAPARASVTMEDALMTTSRASVAAGRVRFSVRNAGTVPHAFGVVPEGMHVDDGSHSHQALLAEGRSLDPGERGTVSVKLGPGRYELICHLSGHYAAGQRVAFAVR